MALDCTSVWIPLSYALQVDLKSVFTTRVYKSTLLASQKPEQILLFETELQRFPSTWIDSGKMWILFSWKLCGNTPSQVTFVCINILFHCLFFIGQSLGNLHKPPRNSFTPSLFPWGCSHLFGNPRARVAACTASLPFRIVQNQLIKSDFKYCFQPRTLPF